MSCTTTATSPLVRNRLLRVLQLLLTLGVFFGTTYAFFNYTVGGVDVSELNSLELTLLKILDYRLHVTVEEYQKYEAKLVQVVISSRNHAFDDLRFSLGFNKQRIPRKQINGLPPSSPISVTEDNQ